MSQRMREQGREVPRVNVSGKFLGYQISPRPLALFSIFLAYVAGYVIWMAVRYICLNV